MYEREGMSLPSAAIGLSGSHQFTLLPLVNPGHVAAAHRRGQIAAGLSDVAGTGVEETSHTALTTATATPTTSPARTLTSKMDGHLSGKTGPETHGSIHNLVATGCRRPDHRFLIRTACQVEQGIEITGSCGRTDISVRNEGGEKHDSPDKGWVHDNPFSGRGKHGIPPLLALHQTNQRGGAAATEGCHTAHASHLIGPSSASADTDDTDLRA